MIVGKVSLLLAALRIHLHSKLATKPEATWMQMCGTQVASSEVTICISSECAPVHSKHAARIRLIHGFVTKTNARTCFGTEHNNQYVNEIHTSASSWICVTNCASENMKQSPTSEAYSRLPSYLEPHV